MATRATEAEVIEIMDTELTEAQVTPFLTAGNLFVTNMFSSNTTLSDATKKEIERWITAHFIASTVDPLIKQEKTGDGSVSYQGTIGIAKGLEYTSYGQQAILLDTSGVLSNAGKTGAVMETIDFIDGGT